MEQQSYLSDLEFNPVLAGAGQRFADYLIDLIAFFIFVFLLMFVFVRAGGTIYSYPPYSAQDLLYRAVMLLFYAMFMFLQEMIFKGRSIGKFITGTKAVNEDGTEMEPKTTFVRSLSRAVPFEAFSAFGAHPWHDKWTKTYVVDVKKTTFNTIPEIS